MQIDSETVRALTWLIFWWHASRWLARLGAIVFAALLAWLYSLKREG